MDWDGHEDFGDLEIRDNGELSEEEEGEEVLTVATSVVGGVRMYHGNWSKALKI